MVFKKFREDLLQEKRKDLMRQLIPVAKKGMVFYSRPFDGTTTRHIKRTILGNGLYHVEDPSTNLSDTNRLSSFQNSFGTMIESQLPKSKKLLTANQTLKILYNISNRS